MHHFAALIGYGADAINPYLAYATYKQEIDEGRLDISYEEAVSKYGKSITEGVVKSCPRWDFNCTKLQRRPNL